MNVQGVIEKARIVKMKMFDKYMRAKHQGPHQGEREKARRRRQIEQGIISVTPIKKGDR